MVKTLESSLKECLKETQIEPNKYPSQVLGVSEELRFTSKCESAI